MAERTQHKTRFSGISNNDDRPSQILAFSFLYDKSTADDFESEYHKKDDGIRLQSNEIKFFHSQKSVWFRELLK